MIRKPVKSGGHIYILNEGETCPAGEACFTSEEWAFFEKLLAASHIDTEQKKEAFLTVLSKKRDIPGYTIFVDFPREIGDKKPLKAGLQICAETIEMLKGRG